MKKVFEWLRTNKTWNIVLWVLMAVFLVSVLLLLNRADEDMVCRQVQVKILPESELYFLDSAEILTIMKGMNPEKQLIGVPMEALNIAEMERNLEANAFVERADVFMDVSGVMQVKVEQRNPVLRIINNRGESYYVAKSGKKMPLSDDYTARVPIATGNIAETLMDSSFAKTPTVRDLLTIAVFIQHDAFWKAQIEQLYVDNFNDVLLIPNIGGHTIVIGNSVGIEEKFTRLRDFYIKGLNNVGWDKYKQLDLRYDNQVVGVKPDYLLPVQQDTAR